jgi:hypothetical protein
MTNQRFPLAAAAAAVAGLSLAATGCILGSNPNENSMTFGGVGGAVVTGGGGSTGTGGASGPNGPIPGTPIAVFDSSIEGFALDTYHDTAQINLNDAMNPANPPPTLTFDGSQGNPTAGSLSVMAPYSGANQYVDIQKTFGAMNLQDWTHKTLHVRVKVTTGTFKGGIQFYVKTGTTFYFAATYTTLATGSAWQEFKLNVDAPMMIGPGTGTYNPAQVISYGMQLNSSGDGAGSTPVTFNIDSFSIDPPFPVDAAPEVAPDTGTSSDADNDAATDVTAPVDATTSDVASGG